MWEKSHAGSRMSERTRPNASLICPNTPGGGGECGDTGGPSNCGGNAFGLTLTLSFCAAAAYFRMKSACHSSSFISDCGFCGWGKKRPMGSALYLGSNCDSHFSEAVGPGR